MQQEVANREELVRKSTEKIAADKNSQTAASNMSVNRGNTPLLDDPELNAAVKDIEDGINTK